MTSKKKEDKKDHQEIKASFRKEFRTNANSAIESLMDLYNVSSISKGIVRAIPFILSLTVTIKGISIGTGWKTYGIIASVLIAVLSIFDVWASAKKDAEDNVNANAKLRRQLENLRTENERRQNKWSKERDSYKKQLSDAIDSWEKYESLNEIRVSIATAESMICEKQNRAIVEFIDHRKAIAPTTNKLLSEIRNPKANIDGIFDELCSCFSGFCHLERSDIVFSAAVKLNENEKWSWVSRPKEKTASIEELQNGDSLFKTVAEKKGKDYDYIPDKSNPGEHYIYDELDESYGRKGSLICWKIGLPCETREISMLISISTYGRQLVEITKGDGIPDDQKEKRITEAYEKIIRDIILKQFEGRLQEELLWYSIMHGEYVA